MKNKPSKRKVIIKFCSKEMLLFSALILMFSVASAQEAIPVSGGNASGETGFLSYSVGQAFYTTVSGTGGFVTEGIQQPYEISAVTGTTEVAAISLELSAYPNPSADYLILNTGDAVMQGIQKLEYRLYDMSSRLLEASAISSDQTSVAMGHLQPSVYFIKIIGDNLEIKTFKIIKK